MSCTAVMPCSGGIGSLGIPSVHGQVRISTSNHEPVNGIARHDSTDLTSEFPPGCHRLFSRIAWPLDVTQSRLGANWASAPLVDEALRRRDGPPVEGGNPASEGLQGGMGLHLRGRGLQLSPYEESGDSIDLSRGRSGFAGPRMNPRGTTAESTQNPSRITKSLGPERT